MQTPHWNAVRSIYAEGIASGDATFETDLPSWAEWTAAHLDAARLVALREGRLVGWAALSPVSERCAYGGVAEVSVYVAQRAQGQGVGRQLLRELVLGSEQAGVWTLQAGIFPENQASVRIHLACGFREVGRRVRLGRLRGVWRDVLLFERRSAIVV